MLAHKDIRIRFEVGGRQYEAVGFLREEESSVSGDEMLARTTAAENGGAVGDEDEAFLSERRAEFPQELRRYYLVTNRRDPDYAHGVSYFYWFCDGWCQCWHWLGGPWGRFGLVVRRCA